MATKAMASLLSAVLVGCAAAPRGAQLRGWRRVDTGEHASLRGLAVVDAAVAYVGGEAGALLRTDDGGATWRDVAPPDSQACDFRDLAVSNGDRVVAMVAGRPARLYHSDDGGRSWRVAHEDPRAAAFFDAVAFHGDVGVAFGDAIDGAFVSLATADGGRTWGALRDGSLPPPRAGEAGFAASGTCVVALPTGDHRFALVTGGNGSRWIGWTPGRQPTVRDLPMAAGAPSRGAFSIAARGRRAVVVGGDFSQPRRRQGTACWTDDGGRSWHAADAGGYRSSVCWVDDETVLAVGSHGASVSHDGGRSWLPFGDAGFHSVAVGRDGAVWACGSEGRVARLQLAE